VSGRPSRPGEAVRTRVGATLPRRLGGLGRDADAVDAPLPLELPGEPVAVIYPPEWHGLAAGAGGDVDDDPAPF